MKLKKIVFCLICVNATLVYADVTDSNTSGVYFDLGAGASKITNLPTGAATVNMNWGYNFNKGFALEAGWAGMPSEQWGLLDTYNVYSLAAKGTIPLGNTFSLYGRLGAGGAYSAWSGTCGDSLYTSPGSAWSMVGVAGVGVSFNVNPSFSLYLENNNYIPLATQTGSFGDTSSLMFGFQYNFGKSNPATSQSVETPPIVTQSPVQITNTTPVTTPASDVTDLAGASIITNNATNSEFMKRVFSDSNGQYIIVRKGDTLSSISCDANVYVTDLTKINHVKNNHISVGQKLYLGNSTYVSNEDTQDFVNRVKVDAQGRRYVEAICGDDLYVISKQSNVDVVKLAKINNIKDIHDVKVGELVYLDDVSSDSMANRIQVRNGRRYITTVSTDTLDSISTATNVSVANLIAINKLSQTDNLQPDTILYLDQQVLKNNYIKDRVKVRNGRKYIQIADGDTLYTIANVTGVPLSQLVQINNLKAPNYGIKVGQILYLSR